MLLLFWLLGAAAGADALAELGGGGLRAGAAVAGKVSMAAGWVGAETEADARFAWRHMRVKRVRRVQLRADVLYMQNPAVAVGIPYPSQEEDPTHATLPGCSWWMLSTFTTASGAGLGISSGMNGVTSSGPWQQ